jgi:hypothetical protein
MPQPGQVFFFALNKSYHPITLAGFDLTTHSSARRLDHATRGRCYDHNFLRFSTIFGEKIGVFLKKPML